MLPNYPLFHEIFKRSIMSLNANAKRMIAWVFGMGRRGQMVSTFGGSGICHQSCGLPGRADGGVGLQDIIATREVAVRVAERLTMWCISRGMALHQSKEARISELCMYANSVTTS